MFWAAVGTIAYTYLIFPIWLAIRGLARPVPIASADIAPSVSVIIPAYNEAATIGRKLDSVLAQNYRADRLQLIVASDGSEDETTEVVRRYAHRGVLLLALPRSGKSRAIQSAVTRASGAILVFSDANSTLAPDALANLVRPFADSQVGGVAGDQRYRSSADADLSAGERKYWDIDRSMKLAESAAGSIVGATGSLYALRRELFRPIPHGVNDDYFVSATAVLLGYRLVFAPDAIAYEDAAQSMQAEYARKVRLMTRGIRTDLVLRGLLNPFKYGTHSVVFFSHKVLRRLVAVALVVTALASPALWQRGWIYRVAGLGQAIVYGLGLIGILAARKGVVPPPLALPAFFCLVHAAALAAIWNVLRGRKIDRWSVRRGEAAPVGHGADG